MAPDVISSLCKAIEGLQNVVLDMQKQIDDLSRGEKSDSTKKNVSSMVSDKVNVACEASCKNRQIMKVNNANEANVDIPGVSQTFNASGQPARIDSNNLMLSIAHVLDSVIEYMLDPKDHLKVGILQSAKQLKEKICENG